MSNQNIRLQILEGLPQSQKWFDATIGETPLPGIVWDKKDVLGDKKLFLYRDWSAVHFESPWYEIEAQPEISQQATERDIRILQKILGNILRPPAHIIDVHCGSGRHSRALAAMGFRMTGIEEAVLPRKRARQLSRQHDLSSIFVPATQVQYKKYACSADIVISMFNSMGYTFHKEDDLLQLTKMTKLLRPSGHLVLDVRSEKFQIQRYGEKIIKEQEQLDLELLYGGNQRIVMETTKSWHNKILGAKEKILLVTPKSKQLLQYTTYGWRTYSIDELIDMLRIAGAEFVVVHEDYYTNPAFIGERIFLVAKKS